MINSDMLFLKVINMSLSASIVALIVILVRLILKKAPKIYSYVLWILVFIRFLCPITIESAISIIPINSKGITYDKLAYTNAQVDTGITSMDNIINSVITTYAAPVPYASINPMQIYIFIMGLFYLIPVFSILVYAYFSYISLKRKLKTATLVERNIYKTDMITTPFLLGVMKPHIYLPTDLSENETKYIILHEKVHIRRKDYIIKLCGFIAVAIHWFNPICWISYYLMCKDMEMSCDEAVVNQVPEDIRVQYSKTLFHISLKQSKLTLPLAFGESNTKVRIKNILNFKKPKLIVLIIAIILVVVVGITGLTNRHINNNISYAESRSLTNSLYKNRTKYIGNSNKVVSLVTLLDVPGLTYDSVELKTKNTPYELNVFYKAEDNWRELNKDDKQLSEIFLNGVLLFATIENMDKFNCYIDLYSDMYPDRPYVTYHRDTVEKILGIKLYEYSKTKEKLEELMSIVAQYTKGWDDRESFMEIQRID